MNIQYLIKNIMAVTILSCCSFWLHAKPNVVLIVADDLGYADVGYHGCKDVETPHIDSIARDGVRFTDGYANGAVCAPTRAALMTGRYQHRFGSPNNPGPFRRNSQVKMGVDPGELILSQRLKPAGYATGCFGKWHLGGEVLGDPSLMPWNRDFDEFFGFLEGAASYIDHDNREKKYWRNDRVIRSEKDYYTDALGREAVAFIKKNKDKPFFLYLPFSAVHAPMQATPEYEKKYSHIMPQLRRKLCAMLECMDDNIGLVLKTLKDEGLDDNTLVIFMSDNGGKPDNNGSLNHPLRGQKGQYFDGGIRVPFCISWPGKIRAGSVYKKPIMGLDVVPTVLAAAGVKADSSWKPDGVDLLPYLTGRNKERPHEVLHWMGGKDYAVRHKDWKLVCQDGQTYLFDLAEDMSEKEDLSSAHPEVFNKLKAKHRRWSSEQPPPNYGWQPGIGPKVENERQWTRPMEKEKPL